MVKVPIGMKAVLFVIGNPLTARKLLEAGGPEVGLYLPTKIYLYEDKEGHTQVTYDQIAPIMAQYGNPQLDAVAAGHLPIFAQPEKVAAFIIEAAQGVAN